MDMDRTTILIEMCIKLFSSEICWVLSLQPGSRLGAKLICEELKLGTRNSQPGRAGKNNIFIAADKFVTEFHTCEVPRCDVRGTGISLNQAWWPCLVPSVLLNHQKKRSFQSQLTSLWFIRGFSSKMKGPPGCTYHGGGGWSWWSPAFHHINTY